MSKYGEKTILQLKELLKGKNAKTSGRKADLVERLESYDRNADFGHTSNCSSGYMMTIPNGLLYKDVNSDSKIPLITESGIETYLRLFQQSFREKSKELYQGKFLKTLRFADAQTFFYFCAKVFAEMIKKCTYKVDIKVDTNGIITETQCECATGEGPEAHCKHVAAVLYGLSQYKHGIICQSTCTQQLQTFHQTKSYTGSPVKMRNMVLRKKGSLQRIANLDPRPDHFIRQPGYESNFRNNWLNSTAHNIPIRQLYAPANIYGVANDHDYLQKTPEDIFLQRLGITAPTNTDQLLELEEKTREQSCSQLWKEERQIRLHASNFGKVVKCMSAEEIIPEKLAKLAQQLTTHRELHCEAIKHGKKYESVAIKAYEKLKNVNVLASGIRVSEETLYLGCSPDGLVGDEGIIEIKCPFSAKDMEIVPEAVPYLYCENGNLQLRVNNDYYYQVMGTMLCTGRLWCDFVVWTFKDLKVLRIERDEEFIKHMKEKLDSFFNKAFRKAILDKFYYRNTHLF